MQAQENPLVVRYQKQFSSKHFLNPQFIFWDSEKDIFDVGDDRYLSVEVACDFLKIVYLQATHQLDLMMKQKSQQCNTLSSAQEELKIQIKLLKTEKKDLEEILNTQIVEKYKLEQFIKSHEQSITKIRSELNIKKMENSLIIDNKQKFQQVTSLLGVSIIEILNEDEPNRMKMIEQLHQKKLRQMLLEAKINDPNHLSKIIRAVNELQRLCSSNMRYQTTLYSDNLQQQYAYKQQISRLQPAKIQYSCVWHSNIGSYFSGKSQLVPQFQQRENNRSKFWERKENAQPQDSFTFSKPSNLSVYIKDLQNQLKAATVKLQKLSSQLVEKESALNTMRIQYIQHIEEREEYWKAIEKDLQDEKFKLGCQILLLEQQCKRKEGNAEQIERNGTLELRENYIEGLKEQSKETNQLKQKLMNAEVQISNLKTTILSLQTQLKSKQQSLFTSATLQHKSIQQASFYKLTQQLTKILGIATHDNTSEQYIDHQTLINNIINAVKLHMAQQQKQDMQGQISLLKEKVIAVNMQQEISKINIEELQYQLKTKMQFKQDKILELITTLIRKQDELEELQLKVRNIEQQARSIQTPILR